MMMIFKKKSYFEFVEMYSHIFQEILICSIILIEKDDI